MQLPFGKKDAAKTSAADDKKTGKAQRVSGGSKGGDAKDRSSKRKSAGDKPTGTRKHVEQKQKATEPTGIFSAPAEIMGPRLLFIAAVVILCVLGLVMIYSSSSIEAYGDSAFGNNPMYFFKQQVLWLAVGTVACVAAAAIPYSFWKDPRVAYFLWGVTAVLLAAVVLGLGTTSLGADRSLRLGPISIQPAEFAKITVILVMTSALERWNTGVISSGRAIGELAGVAVLTLVLIYEQPDLGTAMILIVGILALLMLGGIDIRLILGLIGIALIYFIAVCIVQPYHIDRIMTMLDPWKDAQGNGYQSVQGFLAFGSGGIFGTGLGMSRQKYDYLPYAYNDFIYAVIGEELGLVGALVTLLLFAVLIFAGIRIAHKAKDAFGAIVAGSLTCMIGFQACVNMACVVGMAPVTGKALPFISYGGSSLLATMIMCGLILSVSIRSRLDNQVEKRRENLVVMDGGKAATRSAGTAQQVPQGAAGALGGLVGSVTGAIGGAVSGVAEHLPGGAGNNDAEHGRSARRGFRSNAAADEGPRSNNSRRAGASSRSASDEASGRLSGRNTARGGASGRSGFGAGGARAGEPGSTARGAYGSSSRQHAENSDAGHGYRRASSSRTTRAGYGSDVGVGSGSRSTQREQQAQASRRSRSCRSDMDLELVDIRPREGRKRQQSSRDGGASGARGGSGRPRSSSASHGGTSRNNRRPR